jgi:selenocysteine lyase/cysteine desulfurase
MDEDVGAPRDEWVEKYEEIRTVFARFSHAKPEEVAVVTSGSAGINPIANALRFDGRNHVHRAIAESNTRRRVIVVEGWIVLE